MTKITYEHLKSIIWYMDGAFRDSGYSSDQASHYVLILLFIKRISDMSEYQNFPVSIPQEARWINFLTTNDTYSFQISKFLRLIEGDNPFLSGISDESNLTGNLRKDDVFFNSMIRFISPLSLRDEEFQELDTLGRVVQEYIEKVNQNTLSTPVQLAKLIVSLANIRNGMSVADPMAGTGNLLVEAFRAVKSSGDTPISLTLKGMDYHRSAVFFSKMNLFFHNIYHANINSHDSLQSPFIKPDGRLEQFDRVFVDIPMSAKESRDFIQDPDPYNRYVYGASPRSRMEFMLIQNALAITKPDGRTVVITGKGILFRGASEGEIRQRMVDADIIETIITLPAGILSYTGISPIIVIFNKNKSPERRGKILFVDGSHRKFDRKIGLQHEFLREIQNTYSLFRKISGFSNVVTLTDIQTNDYMLTDSLYIEDFVYTEMIDLRKEIKKLYYLNKQREKVMDNFFQQYRNLGYLDNL